MTDKMIIAGFGGQGVLLVGQLLAKAGLLEGKNTCWLPSYGPEMRGGTANCSICLSDSPIGSPLINEPDILIAMNTPSFDRFADSVKSDGRIFVDCSITNRISDRDDVLCQCIPTSQIAQENELAGMANIVLLGNVLKNCADRLGGVNFETLKEAFRHIIPQSKSGLAEKNIKALMLGMA